jgi:hypothetical protein
MGVLFATRRTVVRGKPELLTNGDFEDYTGVQDNGVDDVLTGWTNAGTGGGDLVEATATVHTGSNAALLTNGNNGCSAFQAITTVRPGNTYHLIFWTRGDGAQAGRYNVYDNTNAADIIAITSTGISGTTYTRFSISFVTPVDCVNASIGVRSPAAAGDAYFDDVSVRLA